jgi:hypothetical protein
MGAIGNRPGEPTAILGEIWALVLANVMGGIFAVDNRRAG